MTKTQWIPFDRQHYMLPGNVAAYCTAETQRSMMRSITATSEYRELVVVEALIGPGPAPDLAERYAKARMRLTLIASAIADEAMRDEERAVVEPSRLPS